MLKRCILSVLVFLFVCTLSVAQVQKVSATNQTGLDAKLASASYNYTLYHGRSPVWGNLGYGGFVEYTLSASAGTYSVQLYYSNGTISNGTVTATENGSSPVPVGVPATGGWGNFQLGPASIITIPDGRSTLRFTASSQFQPYNLAGILLQPVAASSASDAPPAAPPVNVPNRLFGTNFFVNPYSTAAKNAYQGCWNGQSISKIASQPQGVWFGDWNSDPQGDAATVCQAASLTGTVPVMIAYDIVNRDCGGYSSGGAANAAQYQSWIQAFAQGIGNSKVIVILEPDSLTQYNTDGCLNSNQKNERLSLLQYAVSILNQHAPNALIYMDGGPPNGIGAAQMAQALNYAGIANADGFAVNTSNYESTSDSVNYGTQISNQLGGKHFVIDTSRNGAGATWDHQWCNPANRGLGLPPQGLSSGLVDAYLWVQNPGTSDGTCNGGPPAGQFSNYLACTELQNAAF